MPNIDTFDAGNLAIRPTETGVEAFAQAGRRIGAFYNQEGQAIEGAGQRIGRGIRDAGDAAVAYQDHQQINAGADHGSKLWATLQDSWNQTSAGADPHDPSVAKKWREEQLEPALEQFQQGFSTEKSQEWGNHFVNNMRQHYFATTEADMSRLASVAVTNTVRNLANNFSNTAIKDPSAVPAMIDQVDHSIDGVLGANPNIKGPDAARVRLEVGEKVKEQIVKAGAMGSILNSGDPEGAAAAWAKKFPDYINGAEELQLARAAKTQARTNTLLAKQTEIADRQLAQHNVEQARNEIWSKNVTIDPATGRPDIKPEFFSQASRLPMQFPKAPNATETAKTLIDWGESQQKPGKVTSNPATVSDLDGRMFAADNATSAIQVLRAEADGNLTHQDATIRRELVTARDAEPIKDPQFKYAIDGAKQLIEGRTPGEKMLQSGKFAGFMQSFLGDYLKQSRAGTLPPNALDLNDPESLISKSMAPYKSGIAQVISGNGGVGQPPAASAPPPVSLPPIKDRKKGQQYMTGNGMMTWTGTGWLPPPAQAAGAM